MLTQEELAHKSGVGVRTIRDIESGKVHPQARTLRLIIEALGPALGEAGRGLAPDSWGPRPEVPRDLPRALAEFAGRERHLRALIAAVDDGVAVIAVHGMAGVGKTSLAVRAAHELVPRYPDGQLFVDLRGFSQSPEPRPGLGSVLTRVLRRLDPDDTALPTDVEELTARYRSALADRRVLLVLDDAADAEQVESLLPGTSGSLVLATSRRDLSPLTGVHSVPLEPPPMPEAVAMLRASVDRVTDDEAAAVAQRCGRLPLAIGLAAARLRSRPRWGPADLLARLDDEDRLFDELDSGHRGVAAALRASYGELDADHQRLLRRLSLVSGDDFDARAAAVLCELDEERAAMMMESLVDDNLTESRSPGRYRLHDLVRLFATRLAAVEDTAEERDEAFLRLLRVYLHFAYHAAIRLPSPFQQALAEEAPAHDLGLPGFADQNAVTSWIRAERGNLTAAVYAAEHDGHLEPAWHLATAFSTFRMYDPHNELHLAVNALALDIARRLGDERKEAHALFERGRHLNYTARNDDAIDALARSAALNRRIGDLGAATLALRNIALVHSQSGRFAETIEVCRDALVLAEAAADDSAILHISLNMITSLLNLGRVPDAERQLAQAQRRLENDDVYNSARIDNFRGTLARRRGEAAEALSIHTACLEYCRQQELREGVTPVLIELGEDLLRLGRTAEAVARLNEAVEYAEALAYPALERAARNGLGHAFLAAGEPVEAIAQHERAAALAASQEAAYELARAQHGLADAHLALGDKASAREHLRIAVQVYTDCGVPEAAASAEQLSRLG